MFLNILRPPVLNFLHPELECFVSLKWDFWIKHFWPYIFPLLPCLLLLRNMWATFGLYLMPTGADRAQAGMHPVIFHLLHKLPPDVVPWIFGYASHSLNEESSKTLSLKKGILTKEKGVRSSSLHSMPVAPKHFGLASPFIFWPLATAPLAQLPSPKAHLLPAPEEGNS